VPSSPVTAFAIDIPDPVLADLAQRLARTRFPEGTAGPWQAGLDPGYLRELVTYWSTEFDWRARERDLNAVPQFITRIDGQDVHFVHVRSGSPGALPIVLTHGWPSSFLEMLPLADQLANPARHGADPADSFDVIVPSLPGFAFSSLPPSGPVTPPSIAALWVRLVRDVLGYPRFGAYGGDIGAHVTGFLGAEHPGQVIGVYTHHPSLHPDLTPPLSAAEQGYLKERSEGQFDDSYSAVQSSQPDTLAAALLDSPAGLAAWIVEKYRSWADCHGDIESRFTKDTLLTIVTLYWVTGTIGTSFRSYFDDAQVPPLPVVTVPAGITLTPEDKSYPREFAARTYSDIRQWHGADSGGHFFALEEPAVLAARLRSFFRPLRHSPSPR
jgi:pimeloyl-ACP methyl ester carboxylesterase